MESIDSTKWIGDGSDQCGLDVSLHENGSTITFSSATKGTPFNIRLDAEKSIPNSDYYYEILVQEVADSSSLSVGLVTNDGFLPGWKTKGCFYNGNITNGSAGLIIGFGSSIKGGDIIGVYLQRRDGRCYVIFYHNRRCLGAGFSLEDENDVFFYPCLHLSGKATVHFCMPPIATERYPTVFEREQLAKSENDPYSGDWVIDKAFTGPELHELPLPLNSKFKVTIKSTDFPTANEEKMQYHLFVNISNSFRTTFRVEDKKCDELFDKIESFGPCMGTRMMPRPQFAKIENFIQSALKNGVGFEKIILGDDGMLIFSGPTAEIQCSPHTEAFEPVETL